MRPECPLPLSADFVDADDYVDSLLRLITSSQTFQNLCGGVHVLDFLIREPDIYAAAVPSEWRVWFDSTGIQDVMDLLMREDMAKFNVGAATKPTNIADKSRAWRDGPLPPTSLVQYISTIRSHTLDWSWKGPAVTGLKPSDIKMSHRATLGMKPKKLHEVRHFACYIDELTARIADERRRPISHVVDFGSGRNYLGRVLASQPLHKHVIAVESKPHHIEGAKVLDVHAKLAPKEKTMFNKKAFRKGKRSSGGEPSGPTMYHEVPEQNNRELPKTTAADTTAPATLQISTHGKGSIQYVLHRLQDGDLTAIVDQIVDASQLNEITDRQSDLEHGADGELSNVVTVTKSTLTRRQGFTPSLLVLSLHSCGNLLHHGLRSIQLNPNVAAVAMIGCCYNLLTERLGPPTYKLPSLRSNHPRLRETSSAFDPHGFPMSARLGEYSYNPLGSTDQGAREKGIRLNITARMMAVQAPYNWNESDTERFFTRHFYRALIQRIFFDRGLVEAERPSDAGLSDGTPSAAPIALGSLRKHCFDSFLHYVRGAIDRLALDPDPTRAATFAERMAGLTDEEILDYERRHASRKKELSLTWALMAFSAGVVESAIVVDRWQWLRELPDVGDGRCWVERIFDYSISPRNFVVVGIRK